MVKRKLTKKSGAARKLFHEEEELVPPDGGFDGFAGADWLLEPL